MKTRFLATLLTALGAVGLTAQVVNQPAAGASGGRQTGATVVNDGSLGGLRARSEGGGFIVRSGFAGQLYDVKSFAVSATDTNVNEVSTRQLSASSVLDDGTTLAVTPGEVAWAVADGPVHAVGSSGLVTTTNVHADTVATVQGAYRSVVGSLGLLVVNVGADDFGTYADDAVDDAWQVRHFGEGSAEAAATADPDGDEQDNLFEYLAGTGPNDGGSSFRLSVGNVGSGSRELVFSPITAGRTYTLEYLAALGTGGFAPVTPFSTADVGGIRTVTDTGADTRRFYRVRISLP